MIVYMDDVCTNARTFFWHNPKGGFQITCSETKENTKFEPRDAYKLRMLLANGNGYVHDAVAQA